MDHLSVIGAVRATATGVEADLDFDHRLRVDLLDAGLVRVAVLPRRGLVVDRTWSIDPAGRTPLHGRERLATTDFPCPAARWDREGASLVGERLTVTVRTHPLAITVHRTHAPDVVLCADRPTGAYLPRPDRGSFVHYQQREDGVRHLGLGDASGPLDRSGRRVRCAQIDALGYDAERSGPLYKHAPWLLLDRGPTRSAGLLWETLADVAVDLGAEHSNYHGPCRHAEIAEAGVVWYLLDGPRLRDVVPRLHALVGRPPLPPRWATGFGFTSMHHADAEDAQAVITAFARTARERRMPVSSIHFGSGYTAGPDGRRHVFGWNTDRFPDRAALFDELRRLGYRTVANVKPALLADHPDFEDCARHGRFVEHIDHAPAITRFWGGVGASLDFTSATAHDYWRARLRERVLDAGFDGIWNDNNEAELADAEARVDGFGTRLPAMAVRPLHALLMTRASRAALRALHPERRPHTVSRAGTLGIGASAETWTGDNRTSWHTLRWNLAQGLSMSLSGMPLVGHDVGGFAGPAPDAELLLRWVQCLALHPRMVMNSWKAGPADATTPWRHGEVEDAVRAALELRCRFLPVLQQSLWRAHVHGHPVIAPLEYWYDDDGADPDAGTAYLLGPDVLVVPVLEPGVRTVSHRLPAGADWFDLATGERHAGGAVAGIAAPLERLPVLIRAGALLPMADAWDDASPHDATRLGLHLWPGDGTGETRRTLLLDDGLGWGYRDGDASLLDARLAWSDAGCRLELTETGTGRGRPDLAVHWARDDGRAREVVGLDDLPPAPPP